MTDLDTLFLALAHPTRRAILARLREGEATVAELSAPFDVSQPAISKHLKFLEKAGLITRDRDAQRRPRRLDPAGFGEVAGWLASYRQFWEGRFQGLDALLEDLKTTGLAHSGDEEHGGGET